MGIPDAAVPDAAIPDVSVPDSAVPTSDAGIVDAAPPTDAATMGRILISWIVYREGAADPIESCADSETDIAWLGAGPGYLWPWTASCDDHILLSPPLPPQTFDFVEVLLGVPFGTGLLTRMRVRTDDPVVVTAGGTTYVPVVFRLFDEPVPQLQQMCAAAAAYYAASPSPRTFPPSAGHTPPLLACCPTGGICAPNPDLWTASPWSDLSFSVSGLSRFSYAFTSSGSGSAATFEITATADYDCDAGFRTYEINGSIAADGTVVGCDTITVTNTD